LNLALLTGEVQEPLAAAQAISEEIDGGLVKGPLLLKTPANVSALSQSKRRCHIATASYRCIRRANAFVTVTLKRACSVTIHELISNL
jgi:hypothetical protein